MGRPSKLTPEIQEEIVKAITLGATYVDAAGSVGIDYDTFNRWMIRGRKSSKGAYHEFCGAVTKAMHKARFNYTKVITRAAQEGDWHAALEYLKRHDPDNWGDKQTTTIAGDIPVVVYLPDNGRDKPTSE